MKIKNINIRFLAVFTIILVILVLFLLTLNRQRPKTPVSYPVRVLSNMCTYNGTVYAGVNAPYGQAIPQESSIFTIQDDKIYYVEKVQDAFESVTDELLTLKMSDLDGSNPKVLTEDIFLAGAGKEILIGDMLFYGYGYDDDHRMKYAYINLMTGKRKELKSNRIENILGYDGNYLYYTGYDYKEDENIIGCIYLKSGKDVSLASYAPIDEEGYIDSARFYHNKIYCLTLINKTKGYDYRTYEYCIQVRSAEDGHIEYEIRLSSQGSSKYSFLAYEDKLIATLDGNIIKISMDGKDDAEIIANMRAEEYWGILHFASEDGYLYYEAIAETDEVSGNNDYCYRVPIKGGNSELLKEWFTF